MKSIFLDSWAHRDSRIHRLAPSVKLAAAVLALVSVAATPPSWVIPFVALFCGLLVVVRSSGVPWRPLLVRLLWLEPLIIGLAALSLFQDNGAMRAVAVLVKSSLCVTTMLVFAATTPFSDLLGVLRRLGIPGVFVTIVALMYRYLHVLVDETTRMRRARASRTFHRRRVGAWWSAASMVGQLFVRSTERAERIYSAMCARGWR